MKRIYLKAHKDPFVIASPKQVWRKNLIGDNVGNLLFSNASYKLLAARDVQIVTGPLNGGVEEAARINAEFDHVVIPLANAFRLSYIEQLKSLTATIRALKVPVTVLGVGAQMGLDGNPARLEPIREEVRDFISAVLDHSPALGVRGQFTYDYLTDMGFDDVEIIGCPSLFMRGPSLRIHKPQGPLSADAKVSLNLSPYVANLAQLVDASAQTYPNLRYTAQHRDALGMLLHTNPPTLPKAEQRDLPTTREHDLVANQRTSFFVDPEPWIDYLSTFDFSFGTRIHGNIAAILARTPAFVLAHDSRTLELARYHDIPHLPVKSLTPQLNAQALWDAANYTNFNSRFAARFDGFSAFLHAQGLTHVYDPGQDSQAFDRRMAALSYPGDVGLMKPTTHHGLPPVLRRLLGR